MNQLLQEERIRKCRIFTDSLQSTTLRPQDARQHNKLNYSLNYPQNYQTADQGQKQNKRMTLKANKARLSESRHKIFSLGRSTSYQSGRPSSVDRNSKAERSYSQKIHRRHKIFEDWTRKPDHSCTIDQISQKQINAAAHHNYQADIYTIEERDEHRGHGYVQTGQQDINRQKRIAAGKSHQPIDNNKRTEILDPHQFQLLLKQTRKYRRYKQKLMAQHLPQQARKVITHIPITPFVIYNSRQSSVNKGKQIYKI